MNQYQKYKKAYIREYRSFKGTVRRIFHDQKKLSKKRGQSVEYTRQELFSWINKNEEFHRLYGEWVESDYNRLSKPTIDRINSSKGYNFDNIQVLSWRENGKKRVSDNIKNPWNKSGVTGVHRCSNPKYSYICIAGITIRGRHLIKNFKSFDEAVAYRKMLEKRFLKYLKYKERA